MYHHEYFWKFASWIDTKQIRIIEQIQTNIKNDTLFEPLNVESTFHTEQKYSNKTVGY